MRIPSFLLSLMVILFAAPAGAQISRVSVTSSVAEANGASSSVAVSADGRYVAFVSDASNLVSGDTNNAPDVFVKDRQTGNITRVSVRSNGAEAPGDVFAPSISDDGRVVAFITNKVLVPEDTFAPCTNTFRCGDVYVHDRATGITQMASIETGDGYTPFSDLAVLSGNGRYVLFSSILRDQPSIPAPGVQLFIRDLQLSTTERVPLQAHIGTNATSLAISDDGQVIVFSRTLAGLDPTGDPIPCSDTSPSSSRCNRLFVYTRQDGRVVRIDPQIQTNYGAEDLRVRGLSADGRVVLFEAKDPVSHPDYGGGIYLYDRIDARMIGPSIGTSDTLRIALSGDGRTLALCADSGYAYLDVLDLLWNTSELLVGNGDDTGSGTGRCGSIAVTHNGNLVVWDSPETALVPGDTNAATDIFAFNRDEDGDGIPSVWETRFGLNPKDAADGALDSDGDGVTNSAEYQAGTHPTGTFKRYFAEGAANAFFQYRLDVFAEDYTGSLYVTFLGANGKRVSDMVPVGSTSFTSGPEEPGIIRWEVAGVTRKRLALPDTTFSVVIEGNKPFAAERTMRWGADHDNLWGSSAERAMVAPATQWYFAEGATGRYSLFYLLENPNDAAANVTIRYLQPAPHAPIARTYTMAPHSRRTIDVNHEPGLANAELAARITSDLPILAERSMYLSTPSQLFAGGHSGAGIAAPATQWFLAEGATGFFKTYVLVANPGTEPASLLVTYLLSDGTRIDIPHNVDPESRLTIDIAGEAPELRSTTMSTIVRSLNGVPVIVERVSWYPSDEPIEATSTAATTETARRWAVPNAPFRPSDIDSYLLIANPGDEDGTVTITLGGIDDYTPRGCKRTFDILAHSRLTASVRDVCGLKYTKGTIFFSGTIETSGPAVVAERATYWSVGTQFWGAGDATALTPLPDKSPVP